MVLNNYKCPDIRSDSSEARCNLLPGFDSSLFLASTLDYNNQPFCPWRLRPYYMQYDKPVFPGKLLDQAIGREEFSKGVFRRGSTGKYFLHRLRITIFSRHRSFRGYFRSWWSAGNDGSQNTRLCIPYSSASSPMGSHLNFSPYFLRTRNCMASPCRRSYFGSHSRIFLQEKEENLLSLKFRNMRTEIICLKSNGLELIGELLLPSENGLCPALCICHGIPATTCNPEDKGYYKLAQRFCAAGFATLIFNFRGAGKSQGNFDIMGWSCDLQAAIDFLYAHEKIDKTRLGLLGFSGGAAVSVYVASHNSRVSSLVTCACPADFGPLAHMENVNSTIQHFRQIGAIRDGDFPPSIEEWLTGFKVISPINWIDRISPRPLLLVHGDADEVVPLRQAHKLYQKAKQPKDLAIIHGAKHKLRLEEEAMTTALDWLKARCLKPSLYPM